MSKLGGCVRVRWFIKLPLMEACGRLVAQWWNMTVTNTWCCLRAAFLFTWSLRSSVRAESVSSVDAAAGGRGTGGSSARRRRRQRQGTNQRQQTLSGNDGNSNVVDPVSCYNLHCNHYNYSCITLSQIQFYGLLFSSYYKRTSAIVHTHLKNPHNQAYSLISDLPSFPSSY